MPIYRNLLDLKKSSFLQDLFDAIPPPVILDRILLIDKYLADAAVIASRPGGPKLKVYFFDDFIEVLYLLRGCIKQMLSSKSGDCVVLPCGTLVDLDPFYDMLDDLGSLEDTVDELDELQRVLVDFLHAGNVDGYKECRYIVEQLHLLMHGIFIEVIRK